MEAIVPKVIEPSDYLLTMNSIHWILYFNCSLPQNFKTKKLKYQSDSEFFLVFISVDTLIRMNTVNMSVIMNPILSPESILITNVKHETIVRNRPDKVNTMAVVHGELKLYPLC